MISGSIHTWQFTICLHVLAESTKPCPYPTRKWSTCSSWSTLLQVTSHRGFREASTRLMVLPWSPEAYRALLRIPLLREQEGCFLTFYNFLTSVQWARGASEALLKHRQFFSCYGGASEALHTYLLPSSLVEFIKCKCVALILSVNWSQNSIHDYFHDEIIQANILKTDNIYYFSS